MAQLISISKRGPNAYCMIDIIFTDGLEAPGIRPLVVIDERQWEEQSDSTCQRTKKLTQADHVRAYKGVVFSQKGDTQK